MSAPSDEGAAAGPRVWHYDGRSALRRYAMLVDQGDAFLLVEPDRTTGPYAWENVLPTDADTGATSYGLKGTHGWRMDFVNPATPSLAAKLPTSRRHGRVVDRFGLWPASVAFACVAALAIALVLRTPAMVARLVPASVEKRLGDLMVGDFGRNGCADPAGQAALDTLVNRTDFDDPNIDVHVVKLKMVNAVTLPGGHIVIFDGLLKAAKSPDEVAGVIGHELGHVRHRDVTEALVRQMGLSVLLGGLDGNIGGYTNAILATAYSRKAENSADRYAMTLMRQAGVSPMPTAAFFRRLGKGAEGAERLFAYLNTHPVSADRARTFEASASRKATYRSTLDPGQWAALKNICRGSKDESGWRF